ncbi:MAG: ABC transporter permease subunit [Pseudomonadota bacterium]
MTGSVLLAVYVALFVGGWAIIHFARQRRTARNDITSRKTVTFGDESAIRSDRAASIISIVVIFLIWGAFTGSKWVPIHVPGPFIGDTSFTYTAENAAGQTDEAVVQIRVSEPGQEVDEPVVEPGDGFAKNDVETTAAWRSTLVRVDRNDEGGRDDGFHIVSVDGRAIEPGGSVRVSDGTVSMTPKGTLSFQPNSGLQMEPIWMPSPEAVVDRLVQISSEGYQNFTLIEHVGWSLIRVVVGFLAGAALGIPLGYAMGLSGWFRGWFDPIVEFMRPVPPLALIPLVIIWFGIWETGKIVLLFLAALWIMTIAARAGVSGVNITKVHAAYSLGASKWQILRYVIIPNSLPEIFTGARVAMGVCWGTVVAAELVAAQKGAGMMIIAASKFQLTDIVIMGIILIGIIGYSIDMLMRAAERRLVPWKGRF